MKKLLCALLAVCMLAGCLCGCSGAENPGTSGSSGSSGLSGSSSGCNTSGTPAEVDFSQTDEDMFTKRDSNTDIADAVQISLNGDSVSCAASGVNIFGITVPITA